MYDFHFHYIVYRSIFYVYFHPVNYYIFNCFIQLFLMQYLHRYIPVYSGVILCFLFQEKKDGNYTHLSIRLFLWFFRVDSLIGAKLNKQISLLRICPHSLFLQAKTMLFS